MTRTTTYRLSLSAGLCVLAGGLIGCSSGSSQASNWDSLSTAEQAAAAAGIDQVERVWNRAGIEPVDAMPGNPAELEFFVAIDPTDPIIGVVRSAVDEPALDTDAFRWVPMVDAANFRQIGREVPSPKINLPPYESRSSGLVVSRYMNVYYLLVHNTGSKRVCAGFAPGFAVSGAEVSFDSFSRPTVDFTLNQQGRDALRRLTTENNGSAIAAVVDGWVISAPRVSGPVSQGSLTTGTMTFLQAEELAARLNAGAEPSGDATSLTTVPISKD
ncbi:MAG: SecDF P1 head subdomain-containing protein [Phycisphaerales bacterium]